MIFLICLQLPDNSIRRAEILKIRFKRSSRTENYNKVTFKRLLKNQAVHRFYSDLILVLTSSSFESHIKNLLSQIYNLRKN